MLWADFNETCYMWKQFCRTLFAQLNVFQKMDFKVCVQSNAELFYLHLNSVKCHCPIPHILLNFMIRVHMPP